MESLEQLFCALSDAEIHFLVQYFTTRTMTMMVDSAQWPMTDQICRQLGMNAYIDHADKLNVQFHINR